jgi:hypothetical protein
MKCIIETHSLAGPMSLLVLVVLIQSGNAVPHSAHRGEAGLGHWISSNSRILKRGLGSGAGEVTYYDPGLGACEKVNTGDELIAALNHVDFGTHERALHSPACNSCLKVWNRDQSASVIVRIVDKCPGCKQGDLDLSPAAFDKLYPKSVGRSTVSWSKVPCDGDASDSAPPSFRKPVDSPPVAPAPAPIPVPDVQASTKPEPVPVRRERKAEAPAPVKNPVQAPIVDAVPAPAPSTSKVDVEAPPQVVSAPVSPAPKVDIEAPIQEISVPPRNTSKAKPSDDVIPNKSVAKKVKSSVKPVVPIEPKPQGSLPASDVSARDAGLAAYDAGLKYEEQVRKTVDPRFQDKVLNQFWDHVSTTIKKGLSDEAANLKSKH